jgi:hypothetical protein
MSQNDTITISPSNQPVTGLGGQDTITLSSVTAPIYTTDSIDLSMLSNSNITSPYTITSGLTASTHPGAFTAGTGWTTGTNTAPWFTQSNVAPKINLDGEGADIVVNGSSLVDAINSIKDRLNCLQINPKLEAEWEELKALGDQYRKLEQHILDKQATWDRLKAMPKVDID